jgi:hypothetical protein
MSQLFPQLFPSPRPRYTLIPKRLNGISRILVPVAANIALAIAAAAAGNAGSPKPVGELSLCIK